MSILSKLKAKTVIWNPEPGVEIEIQALTVSDGLDELIALQMSDDPEDSFKAISAIMDKTLRKSVPDVTDEEIKGLSVSYLESLMEAITTVNDLENNRDGDKVERIKQLQQQMKEARKKK